MGFLEYALSTFLEKDRLKAKLLLSTESRYPRLSRDEVGFVVVLPEPMVKETKDGERTISLMGYGFPDDDQGKWQLVSLFRAAVIHLAGHVLASDSKDYEEWSKGKNTLLARFATSLIEDVKANAYVFARHPDKLADLAYANTLALKRIRRIDRLVNPATRIMAGLLLEANTGRLGTRLKDDYGVVNNLTVLLEQLKEKTLQSFSDEKISLKYEKMRVADEIYFKIEDAGPITEAPFLPHTEELGACSVFTPSCFIDSDIFLESDFKKCLEFLGGNLSPSEGSQESSGKIVEAEAVQVFDSWQHQKERDKKMISKYEELLSSTRFKSVEIPRVDYTEYLRVKSRCKSEAHRLVESLLVARDALDEDPRKDYGVLDLQEVIQVIASKSPRMDVFMLDENLSKSYSWIILLDASRSMRNNKDFAQEILVILGEVANELLLDPLSWGMYAFSDRFFIIKDIRERYNASARSRIGGLTFDGLTYMPDALSVAGQLIKSRAENMRMITVISDGWPFGYADMNAALSEAIKTLEGGSISLVGVGAKTNKMEGFFRSNCAVYTLRDLTRRFSNLYMVASRVAAET